MGISRRYIIKDNAENTAIPATFFVVKIFFIKKAPFVIWGVLQIQKHGKKPYRSFPIRTITVGFGIAPNRAN
jgi:hypothetical protein